MKLRLSDSRLVLEARVKRMLARNKWEVVRAWRPTRIDSEEDGCLIVWLEMIARRMKECRVMHSRDKILVEWEYGPAHYALSKNDEPRIDDIYGNAARNIASLQVQGLFVSTSINSLGGAAGQAGGPFVPGGPCASAGLNSPAVQFPGGTPYGNPPPGGHNQAAP